MKHAARRGIGEYCDKEEKINCLDQRSTEIEGREISILFHPCLRQEVGKCYLRETLTFKATKTTICNKNKQVSFLRPQLKAGPILSINIFGHYITIFTTSLKEVAD